MKKMPKALVIGANGQDGTFLVKHLLAKGYQVVGAGRQRDSRWKIESPLFAYVQTDLRQEKVLEVPLREIKPDLIFHVAAVHTSAGGDYESKFNDLLAVNVASVHTVIEYQRECPHSRFIYASSAKVFGAPLPDVINEKSPVKNQCLYSITKNTAYNLIDYYRKQHGISASVVYLFNHESELRPADFFIPTVINGLAGALKNRSNIFEVNSLDFYCDWGSAEEFMDIVVDILEKVPGEDFVLAMGECIYARDLVRTLFNNYGLDYQEYLRKRINNTASEKPYSVSLDKLLTYLGKRPRVNIYEVCKKILAANYNL